MLRKQERDKALLFGVGFVAGLYSAHVPTILGLSIAGLLGYVGYHVYLKNKRKK